MDCEKKTLRTINVGIVPTAADLWLTRQGADTEDSHVTTQQMVTGLEPLIDHRLLNHLTTVDGGHTQLVMLNGRLVPQIVHGGLSSGDALTLQGNPVDASNGDVITESRFNVMPNFDVDGTALEFIIIETALEVYNTSMDVTVLRIRRPLELNANHGYSVISDESPIDTNASNFFTIAALFASKSIQNTSSGTRPMNFNQFFAGSAIKADGVSTAFQGSNTGLGMGANFNPNYITLDGGTINVSNVKGLEMLLIHDLDLLGTLNIDNIIGLDCQQYRPSTFLPESPGQVNVEHYRGVWMRDTSTQNPPTLATALQCDLSRTTDWCINNTSIAQSFFGGVIITRGHVPNTSNIADAPYTVLAADELIKIEPTVKRRMTLPLASLVEGETHTFIVGHAAAGSIDFSQPVNGSAIGILNPAAGSVTTMTAMNSLWTISK